MEQIRALFEKTTHLSDKDWRFFSSKLEKRGFPRKSLLLEQGQTEKYLSFVEQGIIRLFIPGEENDLTFGFVFENQFVSAYDSFLIQSPSRYNVEALKDAVVWSISYANL